MAVESRRPTSVPASGGDVERRSRSDDADLVVAADTFDISTLRPGWRRANESSGADLTAATSLLVYAPPAPAVPAGEVGSPASVVNPAPAVNPAPVGPRTASNRQWNRTTTRRLIVAVAAIALVVIVALPWVLLWSGDGSANHAATQAGPSPAARPEAREAPVAGPPEPEPEPTVATPSAPPTAPPPTAPKRNDAPRTSDRAAPPSTVPAATAELPTARPALPAVLATIPTVPAELATPAIRPSVPLPAPVDGARQSGDSRDDPPASRPNAVPTPAPAVAAAAPPPVPAGAADERLVAATLRRFAHAYQQLDANAVAEVWPQADRRVLTRAFDSIESQQVYFERCDVQVADSGATASCGGWLTYVPKVGKKDPRSVSRRWDFALEKGAGQWRITTAAVR